jgi:hypothetical protein
MSFGTVQSLDLIGAEAFRGGAIQNHGYKRPPETLFTYLGSLAPADLAMARNRYCRVVRSASYRFTAYKLRCLFPYRWKVLQQFLGCLIQHFAVLLLVIPGINRLAGSTHPDKLLCTGIIDTEDESPDINRRAGCRT